MDTELTRNIRHLCYLSICPMVFGLALYTLVRVGLKRSTDKELLWPIQMKMVGSNHSLLLFSLRIYRSLLLVKLVLGRMVHDNTRHSFWWLLFDPMPYLLWVYGCLLSGLVLPIHLVNRLLSQLRYILGLYRFLSDLLLWVLTFVLRWWLQAW